MDIFDEVERQGKGGVMTLGEYSPRFQRPILPHPRPRLYPPVSKSTSYNPHVECAKARLPLTYQTNKDFILANLEQRRRRVPLLSTTHHLLRPKVRPESMARTVTLFSSSEKTEASREDGKRRWKRSRNFPVKRRNGCDETRWQERPCFIFCTSMWRKGVGGSKPTIRMAVNWGAVLLEYGDVGLW